MMEMGLCRSNDLIRTPSGKRIYPSYFIHLLDGPVGLTAVCSEMTANTASLA